MILHKIFPFLFLGLELLMDCQTLQKIHVIPQQPKFSNIISLKKIHFIIFSVLFSMSINVLELFQESNQILLLTTTQCLYHLLCSNVHTILMLIFKLLQMFEYIFSARLF